MKTSAPEKPAVPMKKLDPFQIVEADFVAGAARHDQLPAPLHVEVAFAGRSNVGKSSLINALVERKNLVRTSGTPGCTRQVNLFEAKARDGTVFSLVDLPGFGFAKRSKKELEQWRVLIEGYLLERVTLSVLVLLVDIRRGLGDEERDLMSFLNTSTSQRRPLTVLVVATKLDKVPNSQQKAALQRVRAAAKVPVIGMSSVTGEGKLELWKAIRAHSVAVPCNDASPDDVA